MAFNLDLCHLSAEFSYSVWVVLNNDNKKSEAACSLANDWVCSFTVRWNQDGNSQNAPLKTLKPAGDITAATVYPFLTLFVRASNFLLMQPSNF